MADLGNHDLSALPVYFEPNQGQFDPQVKFLARSKGYDLFLTSHEAVFVLRLPSDSNPKSRPDRKATRRSDVLRLAFKGASTGSIPSGLGVQPGERNYFIGNDPAKWHTRVPLYSKAKLAGIYPGVDLVFYEGPGGLEYDFILDAGVDPGRILMGFSGQRSLRLDAQGVLKIIGPRTEFQLKAPAAYQDGPGGRRAVSCRFQMIGDSLGFELGSYDRGLPLTIDPGLVYASYLGGASSSDNVYCVKVDASGDAYMVGDTYSLDFPTVAGSYDTSYSGFQGSPLFVTKINSAGTALIYSTYIASNFWASYGRGIAVDGSGNAVVTGWVDGDGGFFATNYPVTAGAFQTTFKAGNSDAVVTKLNSTGSAILYSSYLGGNNYENAMSVALDNSGNVYVGGHTSSANFPLSGGAFQSSISVTPDAYVTSLNPTLSALNYSTFLGGGSVDDMVAICVNPGQEVYALLSTYSTGLPVTAGGFSPAGSNEAYLARLAAGGGSLVYGTYLGGSLYEWPAGLDIDATGNAYVVGTTQSANFPVTAGAFQSVRKGTEDAFLAKVNPAGTGLVYSTYIGGTSDDNASAVVVDASDCAFVAGFTYSANFPVLGGSLQPTLNGSSDAFVMRMNDAGSWPLYSTFLGGSSYESIDTIDTAPLGQVVVAGYTSSSDFPVTAGAFQGSLSGTSDSFVAKIDPVAVGTPTATYTATLTSTPTKTITPTSTNTPSTCQLELVVNGSTNSAGSWNDAAAVAHPYTGSGLYWTSMGAVDGAADNLADGNGGAGVFSNPSGSGNLLLPPTLEIVYRMNNINMRLEIDYNSSSDFSNGETAGGSVLLTPIDLAYHTYTQVLTDASPWDFSMLSTSIVFFHAYFAGGGGGNRTVDIDSVRLIYDSCFNPTKTVTQSFTSTPTATQTPVVSATPTWTPVIGTPTFTPSPSRSASRTPTFTASPSGSPTRTSTASPTRSATPSVTLTWSPTPLGTYTDSPTVTFSLTLSPSFTVSPTPTRSASSTPTASPTASPSASATATPSATQSATPTISPTFSDSPTISPTFTVSPTVTPGGYQGPNPPKGGQAFVYPSPARGGTATVAYAMAAPGKVGIKVWNENANLVDELSVSKPAGSQISILQTGKYAPGVYFYQVLMDYDSGSSEKTGILKFTVLK